MMAEVNRPGKTLQDSPFSLLFTAIKFIFLFTFLHGNANYIPLLLQIAQV